MTYRYRVVLYFVQMTKVTVMSLDFMFDLFKTAEVTFLPNFIAFDSIDDIYEDINQGDIYEYNNII